MDDHDMEKVLHFLKNDPVVDALYDCKSEVIGPGFFRFKAEIGTFLKKSPLDSPLASSKTYGQLTPLARTSCRMPLDSTNMLYHGCNAKCGPIVPQTICDLVPQQFREAGKEDDTALLKIMSNYGEEVVTALGSEVDRLEKEIQELVPGIRHVDIEAHNPTVPP
uniref:Uncharacterized protein n=1 Tax=Fagus sylvatica TaxID=28930 RepID=A0A2N9GEV5_FAGSY